MQIKKMRFLGASGLEVSALGIGTNRWKVTSEQDDARLFSTFQTALDAGLNVFDTAEIYMKGASELALGKCMSRDSRPVVIATKFAPFHRRLSPFPHRVSTRVLMNALDASLKRLNVESIGLYHIHWPYLLMQIDPLMDRMARAVRQGKIRAVGVSNFSARQMRQAAARLASYDIPLASNEVHYSLMHRQPEVDGVLETCRELNVTLIAYSPLESGKLQAPPVPDVPAAAPSDRTRRALTTSRQKKDQSVQQEQQTLLHKTLSTIATTHHKTISQVALNWLLMRDEHILPIPGSTNSGHVAENLGALDWQLSDEEFAALDHVSSPWKA